MKLMQPSFTSGEIHPILHARVDLARYSTGLAELKNMIVLPHGGVTRRAGFQELSVNALHENSRLIPFEFNSTDAAILEFGNYTMRVFSGVSGSPTAVFSAASPYAISEVQSLRYVQSGNVIFFAHRNHKPMMLTRNSMRSWTFSELPYRGGPFIDGSEWGGEAKLTSVSGTAYREISASAGIFSAGLVGTLLKLEYPEAARTTTITSKAAPDQTVSASFEVKGTLNVTTTGDWNGVVSIDRSTDNQTWTTVRQYKRSNSESQGNWDFTLSEAEDYVLYRVRAQHAAVSGNTSTTNSNPDESTGGHSNYGGQLPNLFYTAEGFIQVDDTPNTGSNDGEAIDQTTQNTPKTTTSGEITVTISVSGFLRSQIYRIEQYISPTKIYARLVKNDAGFDIFTEYQGKISLWSIGAWGTVQGYPCAVAMYQDRLVFAGTTYQPQTIWMSRTGDYANFGVSDPIKDDDAVTITLAGSSADGIHSLLTSTDLLAFTNAGEWKIKGAGDSGAITPSALAAHQQTNIGAKNIQPVLANGRIVFVQSQGQKVFVLGYDLNIDGYAGSELSILSSHIFEGKTITSMAYQQFSDSLLWFALSDGTFASCTYNPEHEVTGWSRHESAYSIKTFAAVSGNTQTEIFAIANRGTTAKIIKFKIKTDTNFTDNENAFESILRTLRITLNTDDGSVFTNKKLISRLIISALKTSEAWAAPAEIDDGNAWQRRRKVSWRYVGDYLSDAELQLDNGFSRYACVQIRNSGNTPLTIAAITPVLTIGS